MCRAFQTSQCRGCLSSVGEATWCKEGKLGKLCGEAAHHLTSSVIICKLLLPLSLRLFIFKMGVLQESQGSIHSIYVHDKRCGDRALVFL